MKNILQNFRLLLLTSLLLILTNCQVEENIMPNQLQNNQLKYSIKNLSQNEIAFNSKIVENLKYLTRNKSNPLEKKQPINELGIIINTDFAKYIEKGKYNSYTFSTVQKYNENIKNILFSLNENGEYDAFLVTYNYTKQEFLNSSPDKLIEKTTITPININLKKLLTAKTKTMVPVWVCNYDYEWTERTGDLVGAGNERYHWVLKFSNCVVINAEVVPSGNTTSGNGTTTYNTNGSLAYSGGGGSATTPTPSMYDEDELVKISVVKTKLNVGGQQSRFLDQNGQIAFEVYDYITNEMFSSESITFSKEILNQMILNPTIFNSITPFLIEKKIDDTQLNPCSKGVFTSVKNTTVCDIAQVLAKLDANGTVYNTTIKSEVAPSGRPAQTVWNSPFNYTIYISTDYSGKTKLFIAASMLHELVHAYFMSLFDDYNNGNPTNPNAYNDFSILFQKFVDKTYPGSNDVAHHEQMAIDYVNAIAAGLQEYQPGLPQQVYQDLAWGGLQEAPIFNTLFPDGSAERLRIINRYTCESQGTPYGQGTPQVQVPVGSPCN